MVLPKTAATQFVMEHDVAMVAVPTTRCLDSSARAAYRDMTSNVACRVVAKVVLGAILGWLQVACLVVGVLETLR
jgi:Na+/H+-translocating membrane pyrophosphatase